MENWPAISENCISRKYNANGNSRWEENFKLFGFSLNAGRWALGAWRWTLSAERFTLSAWVGSYGLGVNSRSLLTLAYCLTMCWAFGVGGWTLAAERSVPLCLCPFSLGAERLTLFTIAYCLRLSVPLPLFKKLLKVPRNFRPSRTYLAWKHSQ